MVNALARARVGQHSDHLLWRPASQDTAVLKHERAAVCMKESVLSMIAAILITSVTASPVPTAERRQFVTHLDRVRAPHA